jgi:hypothetical protein
MVLEDVKIKKKSTFKSLQLHLLIKNENNKKIMVARISVTLFNNKTTNSFLFKN